MGKSTLNYIFMVYTSLLTSKETQMNPALNVLFMKDYYNQADILLIYISFFFLSLFFSLFWNLLN